MKEDVNYSFDFLMELWELHEDKEENEKQERIERDRDARQIINRGAKGTN